MKAEAFVELRVLGPIRRIAEISGAERIGAIVATAHVALIEIRITEAWAAMTPDEQARAKCLLAELAGDADSNHGELDADSNQPALAAMFADHPKRKR